MRSRACFSVILLLTLIACGSDDENCTNTPTLPECVTITTYIRTVNIIDSLSRPLAAFVFTQVVTDPFDGIPTATVTYTVQNLLSRPLCAAYNVSFQLNAVTWSSSGNVMNLAPNGTENKGEIATDPARIDQGGITVTFTSDPNIICPDDASVP
jgi:hypothetical protein